MRSVAKQSVKLPTAPGIYFLVGKGGKILYIGKAANLRARLRSYLAGVRSEKIIRLVSEAKKLRVQSLESEIAAILEEAKWIKKIRPKYNVLLRDDKNYFFVGFTKEQFPKIFITHQPTLRSGKYEVGSKTEYIGPFVNGRTLRKVLKLIRSYFPYCTCRAPHARICLSAQLGLCPGYCCRLLPQQKASLARSWRAGRQGANLAPQSGAGQTPPKSDFQREVGLQKIRQYQETIRHIRSILTGNAEGLSRDLKKKIERASAKQEFELAAKYKTELEGLKQILAHRGFIEAFALPSSEEPGAETLRALSELLNLSQPPSRIEMYDASMLSGTNAVGAMVTFLDGKPAKAEWRLFRIKNASPTNDPAMIAETIERRLAHPEWQFPELILVDGGRAQLAAARQTLRSFDMSIYRDIPVAAIAKGPSRKNDRLFFGQQPKIKKFDQLPDDLKNLLTQIRDETHRFVISFHRRRRKSQLLT